jgi:hypothetical protein
VNIHFLIFWVKDLIRDYKRQFDEGKKAKELAKKEKEEKVKKMREEGAPSQEIRDLENPPKKPLLPFCVKKKPQAKYVKIDVKNGKNKKSEKKPSVKLNQTSDF